ncbi:MAG: SWIM zinc finger family protein [Candidatus Eremiobacteraeota bacterium]|nr:SWIM zinc finger family protein [Candidatus Eremiobacteraeota bacterium]MCW5871388.1 SWIM zinc finger family protein [Candidatus Eremiobacteraeota bacterium]
MWSLQQVEGLAPDAAALKTGRSVAEPRKWSALGRNERALWGLCQGSGRVPYQAQVDLSEPAFRCTCPSRKFPCKHGLGLMLMWAARPQALAEGEPPSWVGQWLAGRDQRAAKKAAPSGPPDQAAAQKRLEAREARVEEGIAFARGWLDDLLRAGLASAATWPEAHWNTAAARLVDLQAPGLARQLRRIPEILGRPEALALHLGRLHLLLEGSRRPGDLQGEIRNRLGWNQSQEEVLAQPGVSDFWVVLGQRQSEQDHLVMQRTWLRGQESGRHALILDFAPSGRPLPRLWTPGLRMRATACFYAGGQRALLRDAEVLGEGTPVAGCLQDDFARALSRNPWIEEFPAVLGSVCPSTQGLLMEGRLILYRQPFTRVWQLLALSGGGPVTVFGEWDGRRLRPLTVWSEWGCEVLCG